MDVRSSKGAAMYWPVNEIRISNIYIYSKFKEHIQCDIIFNYMYHYKIDFLEPLEVSPSGCHHFYEGAQDMLSEQPCALSVTHTSLFCASSLI